MRALLDVEGDGRVSQLLTADQLAERWQVPKSHVYHLTRTGQVPAVKLGRYYRYAPAAIEAFENGEPTTKDAT
jgi:excisionase family DNA binding protein